MIDHEPGRLPPSLPSEMNFDPDGGPHAPEVMKVVVRVNDNKAGIYATVTRIGQLSVGQTVFLTR